MTNIIINKRFCGPKNSANGGYAAGVFAQTIDGPAVVTLKSPPPLDTPVDLRKTEQGYDAVYNETLVASIAPGAVSINPPLMPDDEGIAAAHDVFLSDADNVHLIPYCFVCGDRRAPGDGLRIFSGPAPDSTVNADFWTPAADLADGEGLVRPEFLWAALDCPSAFALRSWPVLTLLGRFAVDIRRRPAPGEKLIVAAWPEGKEGRKYFSSSALYDEDRELIAAANAVWVALAEDSPLLAQLKADRVG